MIEIEHELWAPQIVSSCVGEWFLTREALTLLGYAYGGTLP